MNPVRERLTFRKLAWMAEGNARQLWDHTASILAAAVALVSGKEVSPARFHPFEQEREEPKIRLDAKQSLDLLEGLAKKLSAG